MLVTLAWSMLQLIWKTGENRVITEYIKGNILDTPYDIAHGVNCQNRMGNGVAKVLFTEFPQVKQQYHQFIDVYGKLGDCQPVYVGEGKYVYNLFTQDRYGYDGKKYVSYLGIISAFKKLNKYCKLNGTKYISIPKMGAGLAGGKWEIIEELINEVTPDINIKVYVLEK